METKQQQNVSVMNCYSPPLLINEIYQKRPSSLPFSLLSVAKRERERERGSIITQNNIFGVQTYILLLSTVVGVVVRQNRFA